jgi:hypothetical protein
MGDRQPLREIAGAGEAVDVPPIGVDDRVEAGDQSRRRDHGEHLHADAVAEDGLEAQEQGLGRAADLLRSGRDAG